MASKRKTEDPLAGIKPLMPVVRRTGRKGRPVDPLLDMEARIVGALHKLHGVKLELALNAMIAAPKAVAPGDAHAHVAAWWQVVAPRRRESIRQRYLVLSRSSEIIEVPERLVRLALDRINGPRRG